jgi:hypothetical protein
MRDLPLGHRAGKDTKKRVRSRAGDGVEDDLRKPPERHTAFLETRS